MALAHIAPLWLALLAAGGAAAQAVDRERFGWLGLAPVEAGQTLQQAEASLGAPLQPAHRRSAASCAAARPGRAWGTWSMTAASRAWKPATGAI